MLWCIEVTLRSPWGHLDIEQLSTTSSSISSRVQQLTTKHTSISSISTIVTKVSGNLGVCNIRPVSSFYPTPLCSSLLSYTFLTSLQAWLSIQNLKALLVQILCHAIQCKGNSLFFSWQMSLSLSLSLPLRLSPAKKSRFATRDASQLPTTASFGKL